jgi:hypothetical protein
MLMSKSTSPMASDFVWTWASSRSHPLAAARTGHIPFATADTAPADRAMGPSPELPEDAIEDLAVVPPLLAAPPDAGQQRFQCLPGVIGEFAASHHPAYCVLVPKVGEDTRGPTYSSDTH